jgi:hypothetical protein
MYNNLLPESASSIVRVTRKYRNRTEQHNAARARMRAFNEVEFIGVDGEGVTDANGKHTYVLLSVGDDSYHENGTPLSFDNILTFLWDCYIQNPSAIYIGFYLSYDFTMWLRDLPENRARMLLTADGTRKRQRKMGRNPVPFPVEYGNWQFDLHAGKRFKLRPKGEKRWMYICDTGPFFQTSLLAALNPANWPTPILTDDEYAIILEGKAQRAVAQFDPSMIRYNVMENKALARMMTEYAKGLRQMEIKLNRTQWYGPGQVAQKWLNNIHAPEAHDAKYYIPPEVSSYAIASYYGGWFEIMAHGHIPGITYEYDINSAYPTVIAILPCLEHSTWEKRHRRDSLNGNELTLIYAEVWQDTPQRIGCMPCRTHDGKILRPRHVKGWYWAHEIIAARNAGCIDHVRVYDAWSCLQSCDHKPFADIANLYRQRQQMGKNTAVGKALKLTYNSAYGKLAQSVGEPRYANPILASLVTAGCRTFIWNAIASHPNGLNAVTMVATDGVYFTSPHPNLPISEKLGEWSVTEHSNLCQFMPGIYWDDKTRLNKDGKIRSRGVSANDLRGVIRWLDNQWIWYRDRLNIGDSYDYPSVTGLIGSERADVLKKLWPQVDVPIAFGLVSAKLALHRNDWSQAGMIQTKPRVLSGNPSDKRNPDSVYLEESGIVWTNPYEVSPDGVESVPYDRRLGLELRDMITEDDIISPDGVVMDEFYEWMQSEH